MFAGLVSTFAIAEFSAHQRVGELELVVWWLKPPLPRLLDHPSVLHGEPLGDILLALAVLLDHVVLDRPLGHLRPTLFALHMVLVHLVIVPDQAYVVCLVRPQAPAPPLAHSFPVDPVHTQVVVVNVMFEDVLLEGPEGVEGVLAVWEVAFLPIARGKRRFQWVGIHGCAMDAGRDCSQGREAKPMSLIRCWESVMAEILFICVCNVADQEVAQAVVC